jgi:hypothetical protein
MGAKKQAGSRKQKVSDDDVLDFLESALAFDCALILAALAQFLFDPVALLGEEGALLASFQKSLKNGLPDNLSISVYEAGFADRFIAQTIRDALLQDGFEGAYFDAAKEHHSSAIERAVALTPAYFRQILTSN